MAVEAALVTPLIMILVFGIIEFSFALRDYIAVTSASRTGARIASASPGEGPQQCDEDESGSECNNTNAPAFAKLAANAMQVQGAALDKDQIDYVLVYKANDDGYPGSGSSMVTEGQCAAMGNCVVFQWVKASNKFKYSAGSWDSSQVDACAGTADSVGVYLSTTHKFFTGLFGATVGIGDYSVMRFEPLTNDTCAPGDHA